MKKSIRAEIFEPLYPFIRPSFISIMKNVNSLQNTVDQVSINVTVALGNVKEDQCLHTVYTLTFSQGNSVLKFTRDVKLRQQSVSSFKANANG